MSAVPRIRARGWCAVVTTTGALATTTRAVTTTARGVAGAVRARPLFFTAFAFVVLAAHILAPPLVLSIVRKPWDYVAVNAWLASLPDYIRSDPAPLAEKVAKLRRLALFWVSSDNPYGTEWGFAVDVGDLARMTFASLLIATYFTLWRYRDPLVDRRNRLTVDRRSRPVSVDAGRGRDRRAAGPHGVGIVGACASVLGLTAGPCSVMGCGAPVIPVVGLAFAGLSSTTLHVLADLSTGATAVVLVGLTLGVAYLGWITGAGRRGAGRP